MSIRQTLITIKNESLRPYYALRTWKPVWRFLNAEAIDLGAASTPSLSEAQKKVVRDLREDGIAITHLDDLFPGRNLLAEMQTEAARLEASAIPNQKKTFLTQLIPLYPELHLDDLFVRFSLSHEIMECVSGYLGMWPKLYYYTLGITSPVASGEAPRQSQRWHRDPEDRNMCKVFVYLTDVDASAGPFTYVRRSVRDLAWGKFYPQKPPHGRYPPEGAVEQTITARVCTGRAGTVIFADTSGLHKGGYATTSRRVMSTTGYVTKACPRGVFYTRAADFVETSKTLDDAQRFALKNTKIANRKWKY